MKPISVFIIALNEADRIGRTLDSVRAIADDVIVIDSGSTDGTQELCARLGAKVIFHPFAGYGPQKRFAEEQCQHEWVLNLDADEVLSPALIEEITQLDFAADGYTLKIADALPGEAIPSRFAHTTKAVRLYRLSKGRYAESSVHDRVHFVEGAVIVPLKHRVWHYSVRSIAHAIEKMNRYSSMQADNIIARGKTIPFFYLRLATEPFTAFFKSYIIRRDCLRGWRGFVNAVTYALFRFVRLAKVLERR